MTTSNIVVVDIDSHGAARSVDTPPARPAAGWSRWIDIQDPSPELLRGLGGELGLHPLAVEDCLHFDQRPKVEEYPGHLFVVIHTFSRAPGAAHIDMHELHCFLLAGLVITVHDGPLAFLAPLVRRLESDAAFAQRGVDFLLHAVCDAAVDSNFPVLDHISDDLDLVEEQALASMTRHDLAQVFRLKKILTTMRRALSPQRDVFALLGKGINTHVGERTHVYFRDLYDHLIRISEQIDAHRDLLANVLEVYLSAVSNRTNEIVKRLTIMSSIFLPLSFVVGFFGQNFTMLPWGRPGLLVVMLVLVGATPLAMLWWFHRLGWLRRADEIGVAPGRPVLRARRRRRRPV